MFVEHPLIKTNSLEYRKYQDVLFRKATKKNLMIVLPTGLGKTNIALLLAAERLVQYPESKILVMAPTKPLVSQHHKTFVKFMNFDKEKMVVVTGTVNPKKRGKLYEEKQIIFATPQTINNDIEKGRLSLKDFSLLVIDEVHHAVGRYAYPFVAKKYIEQAKNPRILGLTASPSSQQEKIREICDKCGIESIEIRTEEDEDVTPYIKEKKIQWIEVVLPDSFYQVKEHLDKAHRKRLEKLIALKFLRTTRVPKRVLLDLQGKLAQEARRGFKKAFYALSLLAQAIKIEHALLLLETQGIGPLHRYFKKLKTDKKAGPVLADKNVSRAIYLTEKLFEAGAKHPKISKLCSIVSRYLSENPDAKIIIFANYRDSVNEIVSALKNIEGTKPVAFVGQKTLSQKEQIRILNEFKEGKYNILVVTSIGEEGLDIPSMDIAIFYEPVPSEIRVIQRRGRVGRQKFGKIIILITKGTRDEAYYWSAKSKEKKMKHILKKMSSGQKDLSVFTEKQ
jgi:Fanconi anemia group M protein